MNLTCTRDDVATMFVLSGQVTSQEIDPLKDPLMDAAGPDVYRRPVLLDLAKVSYIDSSAVSWFLVRNKLCREQGGKLILIGVTPMVRQILAVLKLDRILKLVETPAQARDLLTATSPGGAV